MIIYAVMGFVPIPQKAMHDVFISEPYNKFPEEKRVDDNKQIKYDH
jgi:hypothetical protein